MFHVKWLWYVRWRSSYNFCTLPSISGNWNNMLLWSHLKWHLNHFKLNGFEFKRQCNLIFKKKLFFSLWNLNELFNIRTIYLNAKLISICIKWIKYTQFVMAKLISHGTKFLKSVKLGIRNSSNWIIHFLLLFDFLQYLYVPNYSFMCPL